MAITPAAQRHRAILGKDPSAIQLQLYEKFPDFLGFSDRELNAERLEAIVLLALTSGSKDDRVILFAPIAHEVWVLENFNAVADSIFSHCKTLPNRVAIAQAYKKLFEKIALTGRLLQVQKEPTHWLSFGFASDDPVPEWMGRRLL